ncbi:carbamoyltransferase HypF [Ostreiculturibacter nitratireducens]|uniref:carbamoyltransferase HypF n=1 Tax=Ostreiculturibacter nitratireducens TaxID=3075226 RepID=UPI0031B5EBE7
MNGATGLRIRVRGRVQGVGFRPFVWHLAQRLGIVGEVKNDAEGVLILAAGPALPDFEAALSDDLPPLAKVTSVESTPHRFAARPTGFLIVPSTGHGAETGVVPDAATCTDCAAEIRGPGRRQGYAFTNCTNCGPRFSILRSLPYDRAATTMAEFEMCPACRAEYEDPADRRFHAQPIACPACGPRLWLEAGGEEVPGDPVAEAARRLRAGQILAIKGLGGFHLACDATSADALATLRARKRRPGKPFALMASLPVVRVHAHVPPAAEALLASPAAPIVLLDAHDALPKAVAPGLSTLGFMLPHTPLHHLLLNQFPGPVVMTSGNLSGEPQVTGNAEARAKLGHIADAFLMHDREIARKLDDGVERITPRGPVTLRRGRGRAPSTLPLPPGFEAAPRILAVGGQIKSAPCLLKSGEALLSHHLGDLDDPLAWAEFLAAEADYAAIFEHLPEALACDLHPGYRATRHAETRGKATGLPLVHVQHHHAHLAACLGENLWPLDGGPVAGIVLDGTGLGPDGTSWGGELLLGDYRGFTRAAQLAPAPLPGGDAASREPWRNALVRLDAAGLPEVADRLFPDAPRAAVRAAIAAGVNAPAASSAGRLFDAVAACLWLCPPAQSYEGEAAMRLETLAEGRADPYPMGEDPRRIDPAPMFRALAHDLDAESPGAIAARFHAGLAEAFAVRARRLVETGAARAVALSGGCFQNARLLELTLAALDGLPVLTHGAVPPNDGGLALGQALVAAAKGS